MYRAKIVQEIVSLTNKEFINLDFYKSLASKPTKKLRIILIRKYSKLLEPQNIN